MPNDDETLDSTLTIRLTTSDRKKLEKWSDAIGMSPADVIRELISKWFAKRVTVTKQYKTEKDLE